MKKNNQKETFIQMTEVVYALDGIAGILGLMSLYKVELINDIASVSSILTTLSELIDARRPLDDQKLKITNSPG